MKSHIILIILFIFLSCSYDTNSIKNLNADNFKLLLEENNSSKILDVRTPEEFLSGHLEGSKNINFHDKDFLKKVMSSFSSNDSIYIYCRSGGRSFKAAKILEDAGFNYILNLKDGIVSWKENGNNIIKKESAENLETEVSKIDLLKRLFNDPNSIKSLNPDDFESLLSHTKSSKILDVRTPEEFLSEHLEGSKNINFYDKDFLKKVMSSFSSNDSIYIYCRSGGRSFKAAKILEDAGFNYIFNLKDGVVSWKENGNTIIKKESAENLEISLNDFHEILSKNETVLVDIGATWCGPCKEMYPIIKEIEKENIFDKVIFIDFDSNKDLIDIYNIKKIPTFIIFRNGNRVFRHLGPISKQDLINAIKIN